MKTPFVPSYLTPPSLPEVINCPPNISVKMGHQSIHVSAVSTDAGISSNNKAVTTTSTLKWVVY